jgi:hypothetical protein
MREQKSFWKINRPKEERKIIDENIQWVAERKRIGTYIVIVGRKRSEPTPRKKEWTASELVE